MSNTMSGVETNVLKETAVAEEEETKTCPFPVQCCGNELMLLEVSDATGFQLVSFCCSLVSCQLLVERLNAV